MNTLCLRIHLKLIFGILTLFVVLLLAGATGAIADILSAPSTYVYPQDNNPRPVQGRPSIGAVNYSEGGARNPSGEDGSVPDLDSGSSGGSGGCFISIVRPHVCGVF